MSIKSDWLEIILANKELSPMQKNVMVVIYTHMNQSLFCYPSRSTIKEKLGKCSINRITEATKKAEKLGLIKKGKRRINGNYSVCTYRGIVLNNGS